MNFESEFEDVENDGVTQKQLHLQLIIDFYSNLPASVYWSVDGVSSDSDTGWSLKVFRSWSQLKTAKSSKQLWIQSRTFIELPWQLGLVPLLKTHINSQYFQNCSMKNDGCYYFIIQNTPAIRWSHFKVCFSGNQLACSRHSTIFFWRVM